MANRKADLTPLTFKDVLETMAQTPVLSNISKSPHRGPSSYRFLRAEDWETKPEMEEWFGTILDDAPNKTLTLEILGIVE